MDAQTFDPLAFRSQVPPEAVTAAAKSISKQAGSGKHPKAEEPTQPEAFGDKETGSAAAHGVARDQLRAFVERIERLEEEKQTIAGDIKDVYGEAKGVGFDTKILRKVIAIRKQDKDERIEQEAVLDTYLHALGMIELPAEA
ncbi:uncharacterized protein (UPF0335 family) [Mycoplana sp. BE70]|nr:uncharacterized protein (UPF0335 family) [Mycoplana sp. BE70]